jgi:hypothetical protein
MTYFFGTTIAVSPYIYQSRAMETDMDSTANLLAALRRVRSFPSYASFMAGHERQRIKRELQKRLLRLRRQRQSHKLIHFVAKKQQAATGLLHAIFH